MGACGFGKPQNPKPLTQPSPKGGRSKTQPFTLHPSLLRSGVGGIVGLRQVLKIEFGVDLRAADIGVAK